MDLSINLVWFRVDSLRLGPRLAPFTLLVAATCTWLSDWRLEKSLALLDDQWVLIVFHINDVCVCGALGGAVVMSWDLLDFLTPPRRSAVRTTVRAPGGSLLGGH